MTSPFDFCRLFETSRGQVLVVKEYDDEDGKPDPWTVALLAKPTNALGPCTVALGFSTQEKRDRMFNAIDEGKALKLTACLHNCLPDGDFSLSINGITQSA